MPDRTRARTRKLLPWGCITAGLALIATILLWPALARASGPAQLCEAAAQRAARAHDVPLDVMRAIALVETGRNRDGQMTPWPWAIHAQGRGHWLPTRDAALELVRETLATGRRNIDLGCFQVNWHWHGHEFTTLEDMIDPAQNADYAARLLRGHKARLGRWDLAAGAYHSATPEHASRYIARFSQARKTLGPTAPAVLSAPAENRFALLQPGGQGARGSLVPHAMMTGGARLIDMERVAR